MDWNTHHPLVRTQSLEKSILMPFSCDRISSHSVGCLLFVYCGLELSHDDCLSLRQPSWCHCVSAPSLHCCPSEGWLNQTKPPPDSRLLVWSDIPSAELSPRSVRAYPDAGLTWTWSSVKSRSWNERWFGATYDSPSLMRIRFNLTAEGLHRQWAFAVLCSIWNFPPAWRLLR